MFYSGPDYSFAVLLTHYHPIPHFHALKLYSCGKHCEKRRICFSHNVFFLIWCLFSVLNACQNVVCNLFQFGWLVVLGFNATLTGHIMAVGDAYMFPGFLTLVLTLFFPKPPTTFPTCFCRDERRKYAGKKCPLNQVSNLQLPGHESDMLTTEPLGWGLFQFGPV